MVSGMLLSSDPVAFRTLRTGCTATAPKVTPRVSVTLLTLSPSVAVAVTLSATEPANPARGTKAREDKEAAGMETGLPE